jgi:hypothetical protein
MRIERSTWILVLAACILGGVVYLVDQQNASKIVQPSSNSASLFNFVPEDIESLTILQGKNTLVFKHNSKTWQMKKPLEMPANRSAISFLIDLLVDSQPKRSFPISLGKLTDYGLEHPNTTIVVTLLNHQIHQIQLGQPEPQGHKVYALVDKRPLVYLLPIEFAYAVDRQLSEWQEKP